MLLLHPITNTGHYIIIYEYMGEAIRNMNTIIIQVQTFTV